jgi:hypothetical protein
MELLNLIKYLFNVSIELKEWFSPYYLSVSIYLSVITVMVAAVYSVLGTGNRKRTAEQRVYGQQYSDHTETILSILSAGILISWGSAPLFLILLWLLFLSIPITIALFGAYIYKLRQTKKKNKSNLPVAKALSINTE